MKKWVVISFMLIQCISVKGQIRFFTLLPGGFATQIHEYQNYYVSVGLGYFASYENFVQLNLLNKNGVVMHENYFKVDTSTSTDILTNAMGSYSGNGKNLVASYFPYYDTGGNYYLKGLLLGYNEFFLDTIYHVNITDYANAQMPTLIYGNSDSTIILGSSFQINGVNIKSGFRHYNNLWALIGIKYLTVRGIVIYILFM